MKKRIITGVVGGAFIAYITYIGGIVYDFVFLCINTGLLTLALYL